MAPGLVDTPEASAVTVTTTVAWSDTRGVVVASCVVVAITKVDDVADAVADVVADALLSRPPGLAFVMLK